MDKAKSVRLYDIAKEIFDPEKVYAQSGYVSQHTFEDPDSQGRPDDLVEDSVKSKLHEDWALALGLELGDWHTFAKKIAWGVGHHALDAEAVIRVWQSKRSRGDFIPDPDYISMKLEKASKRTSELDCWVCFTWLKHIRTRVMPSRSMMSLI